MERELVPVNRKARLVWLLAAGGAISVLSWIGLWTVVHGLYEPAAVTKISDLEVANKIQMINSSGPTFTAGAGDPNGAITAPIGSIRMRTDTAVLYQNTTGAMVWTAFGTGTVGGTGAANTFTIWTGANTIGNSAYPVTDSAATLTLGNNAADSTVNTGTMTLSTITAGSVLFAGTAGLVSQDNTAFNWDNTNKSLLITSPNATALGGRSNSTTSGTMFITNTNVSGPSDFFATDNAGTAKMSFGYGNATYVDTARAGRTYIWRNTGVNFVFARTNIVDGMLFDDGNFNLGTTTTNPAVKLRVEGIVSTTVLASFDTTATGAGANVGHDATLSTNTNRGWRVQPFPDGNVYIDSKTHAGGTTFYRAGAGAEAGSARTVFSHLNASGNIGINGTAATAQRVLIAASTGQHALTAQNTVTGQIATTIAVNAQQTGSYNTTAGVLQSYGVAGNVSSTRSAGANNLQNIGVYANASGAQVNTALHTDNGSVLLNQISGNTAIGGTVDSTARAVVFGVAGGYAVFARNILTGQTIGTTVIEARPSGTYDTTAGGLESIAVFGNATSTRSAGANNLSNYGGRFTATGAQINRALQTDAGDVLLNATSGSTSINGNTTVGDANTDSHTINGLVTGVAGANQHGVTWSQSTTGQTTTAKAVFNASNTGTYDTTAGVLSSRGVNVSVTSTRSAGANDLQNIAGAFTASGAQSNIALVTFDGDVVFNSSSGATAIAGNATIGDTNTDLATIWGHTMSLGTAPTPSACGAGPTVAGTDRDMKVTPGAGATTCTLTFSRTYTVAPVCVNFPEGGAVSPTCTISATAITCTVAVASAVYNFHCEGTSGAT